MYDQVRQLAEQLTKAQEEAAKKEEATVSYS
jgi:hypothetical protein